jgi:hypothetical protein
MRAVTRSRYYARSNLSQSLRDAEGQMKQAALHAGKIKNSVRKRAAMIKISEEIHEMLEWAMNLPVLPEEKLLAKQKRKKDQLNITIISTDSIVKKKRKSVS